MSLFITFALYCLSSLTGTEKKFNKEHLSHELYVCYGFVFVLFFSKLFYTIVECLMSFVLFFSVHEILNLQSCNLTGLLVFFEEHNMFFSSHWAKKKKKFTESKVIYLFISLLVSKRDRLVFVDGL